MRRHMRNVRGRRLQYSQSGSAIVFLAAILLPLLFFLFGITIDVARYYSETRTVQNVLDEASLFGNRYLPFSQAAESAVTSYLHSYREVAPFTAVEVDNRSITLRYVRPFELFFPQIFGINLEIPVSAFARSNTSPLDVLIAMDTSSYLGPTLPTGEPWDNDDAAQFFELYPILFAPDEGGPPQPINPQLLSEQCFGRALAAIKRTTITTFEYLSSIQLHSIGLALFPGDFTPLELVRAPIAPLRSGDPSDIPFLAHAGSFVSNDLCAAAAQQEPYLEPVKFPVSNPALGGLWTPPDGAPARLIEPPAWHFNPEYGPFLRASQLIWSQVRRDNEANAPNTPQVILQAGAAVLSAENRPSRGAISDAVTKIIIVIAGDMPWSNGLRLVSQSGELNSQVTSSLGASLTELQELSDEQSVRIRLLYVVLRQPGSEHFFDIGATALTSIFQQTSETTDHSEFTASLISANNTDELSQQVSAVLALEQKGGVLSQ